MKRECEEGESNPFQTSANERSGGATAEIPTEHAFSSDPSGGVSATRVAAIAGISGGRTSALMAEKHVPADAVLSFQNTSREDERTLVFLRRLEDHIKREIVWLEWRPPPRVGDPPRMFGYERVTFATACRNGDVFRECMRALAAYRRTIDKGPIAPWARGRICTSYLKHRVAQRYAESLWGDEAYEWFIGLRADEPERVYRIRERETAQRTFRVPLFDAGITKADVNEHWRRQPFDLELDGDYQGNCTACFLKDHADLARVLGEPQTDAQWWFEMEEEFPRFGGQNFPGYRVLAAQRDLRLAIESDLRANRIPTNDGSVTPRRFHLIVKQEAKRIAEGSAGFSCACESSYGEQLELAEIA